MIHDTALSLTVANRLRLPEKILVVTMGTISWQLSPDTRYGPVLLEMEEEDRLVLQILDSTSPLVLTWSEEKKFIMDTDSRWAPQQESSTGSFRFAGEKGIYSIRYHCEAEGNDTIPVTLSAEMAEE